MHRSIGKVEALIEKQSEEQTSYTEVEEVLIDDTKKRLQYESIRLSEEEKILQKEKEVVDGHIGKVDDKVYEDTKE